MTRLLCIFTFLISLTLFSQSKKDINAYNVAMRISTAMELNAKQTDKVLKLLINRNKKLKKLKKKYLNDKDSFKVENKEVQQKFNAELQDYVGPEKWMKWVKFNKK